MGGGPLTRIAQKAAAAVLKKEARIAAAIASAETHIKERCALCAKRWHGNAKWVECEECMAWWLCRTCDAAMPGVAGHHEAVCKAKSEPTVPETKRTASAAHLEPRSAPMRGERSTRMLLTFG